MTVHLSFMPLQQSGKVNAVQAKSNETLKMVGLHTTCGKSEPKATQRLPGRSQAVVCLVKAEIVCSEITGETGAFVLADTCPAKRGVFAVGE